MYPSAEEAAAVLAVMLKRSGQNRARVSSLTVKKVARRKTLRNSFIGELSGALANSYDWVLVELSTGGFGAFQVKALEAAKPVTGSKYLSEKERKSIDRGQADFQAFHTEVADDEEDVIEDD